MTAPKCPRCGSDCHKGGMVHDRCGRRGQQRWECKNRKTCKWHGTQPIGLARAESSGIDAARTKARLAELKTARGATVGYVITAAQNATAIHRPFFESLLAYCKINTYQLIVIPYRYKNPTSMNAAKDDDWWAPELAPYLLDHRISLNKNIAVLGDVKTQPTANSPLQGFETLTGEQSAVIGHPKLELTTVPTPQQSVPKIMTTTGAVTKPNYIPSKAGKKGEHHHTFGACVVEVTGKRFHMRQLVATGDGAFCDLEYAYTGKGRVKSRVVALVMGDTHVEFVDPGVVNATFTNADSMLNTLKPKYLVWHDVYDCYARNHHERNDVFVNLVKHRTGRGNVEAGIDQACAFVDEHTRPGQINIFVPSNHPNEHLARWVKETDPRNDLENCVFWSLTFVAMANAAKMTDSGAQTVDPFYYWAEKKLKKVAQARFLNPDEGFIVQGIEVGFHGHQGSNGARGSRVQFGKIGVRSVIGHSHSPGITNGAYQVGTSSRLRLSYNHGLSSWMHTHCLIYANGKRSLVNIVGDEWRA